MILPSKHLSQNRALLTVGALILRHLSTPVTVSALWEQVFSFAKSQTEPTPLRYDAFVLTLDLLFLMDAIVLREGLLYRRVL
jgi:cytochrome c biogenesis factor